VNLVVPPRPIRGEKLRGKETNWDPERERGEKPMQTDLRRLRHRGRKECGRSGGVKGRRAIEEAGIENE